MHDELSLLCFVTLSSSPIPSFSILSNLRTFLILEIIKYLLFLAEIVTSQTERKIATDHGVIVVIEIEVTERIVTMIEIEMTVIERETGTEIVKSWTMRETERERGTAIEVEGEGRMIEEERGVAPVEWVEKEDKEVGGPGGVAEDIVSCGSVCCVLTAE